MAHTGPLGQGPMTHGAYDPLLVAVSVGIAVLAGYTALDLANSVLLARGRARHAWLAGGALAMGVGIWSMHFVGMLALRLPGVPIAYDIPLLVLSVAVAIAASALALLVVTRPAVRIPALVLAGLSMGAAICGMHYIGIRSMRVGAEIVWDARLVAASIVIAVAAAFAALRLAVRFRSETGRRGLLHRVAGGGVMGVAIAGMHYTAMLAMSFAPLAGRTPVRETDVLATDGLALAVTLATLFVLGIAIAGSIMDRALTRQTALAEAMERRAREESALREVARVLAAAASVEEIVQRTAESAVENTHAFGAYIERAESPEPGTEVEVVAVAGEGVPPIGTRVPYPGSLTEEMIERSEPALVVEIGSVGESMAPYLTESCRRCTGLVVPLSSEGQTLGALILLRGPDQDPFGPDEAAFVHALGAMVSTALRRVLLLEEVAESERRFRELAENVREVFWSFDAGLRRTLYVSPAYAEIWGRSTESLYRDPTSFLEAVHPEDRERVAGFVERIKGEEAGLEYRITRPDGEVRWVWVRSFPVRDEEGVVQRIVGVSEDVTARKGREEELRFLADAARVLSSSLEYEQTLDRVARLAVPRIADWCAVDVLEAGAVRRLAVAHWDPAREELAREVASRYPPDPDAPAGVAHVLRTGEPELIEEIPEPVLRSVARDEEHFGILAELGMRSAMIVPMLARGRVLGAITLISAESGRRYDPQDLAFAEELAGRAALAVDNARLYRQAEAARGRVTRILESITDAFFALDRQWRFTYLNHAAREVVVQFRGAGAGELVGQVFWDMIPELRGTRFEEEYRRAAETHQEVHFEEYFPPWDTWFSVHAYPSAEGLSVFFRDVTTRKRAEEGIRLLAEAGATLAASLDYQETLGSVARIVVGSLADYCLIDLVEERGLRRVAAVHRDPGKQPLLEAARRYPAGPESPLSRPLRTGEPVLIPAIAAADVQATARSEEHRQIIERLGPRSIMVVPLLAHGETLGMINFVAAESGRRYTTDDLAVAQELARRAASAVDNARLYEQARRRATEEEALRAGAQAVVSSFTVPGVVQTIASSAMQAMGASGAFVEWIDIERDEVEVVSSEGAGALRRGSRMPYAGSVAEAVIEKGEPEIVLTGGVAIRPHARDLGRGCPGCAALAVPLLDSGGVIGVLTLLRGPEEPLFRADEIARAHIFGNMAALAFRRVHLLEEAERRRDELLQVVESRSRLMRGFSHDVKNPLGAADGYLQLLEEGIYGALAEKQRESVERARRSLRDALELIESILELARAESGEIRIDRDAVDVRPIAWEMAEEYRARAEAKGLAMETHVPDELTTISSDSSRIRQVLGNLLSNAVKYTREGGVTVRVEEREGREEVPGRWVAVDVSDTGPGIPEEQQHLLFQEFKRIEPAVEHGAGIGLAISRRIARALGGDVTATSEAGKGSTFTLWLPLPGVDRPSGSRAT